mmetsp:Transcript_10872/g.16382  ORF Transcript_10872/g.16382 Transcript_10872/m.16382 type:complete len:237 (+) Transcript_10872:3-713(+)
MLDLLVKFQCYFWTFFRDKIIESNILSRGLNKSEFYPFSENDADSDNQNAVIVEEGITIFHFFRRWCHLQVTSTISSSENSAGKSPSKSRRRNSRNRQLRRWFCCWASSGSEMLTFNGDDSSGTQAPGNVSELKPFCRWDPSSSVDYLSHDAQTVFQRALSSASNWTRMHPFASLPIRSRCRISARLKYPALSKGCVARNLHCAPESVIIPSSARSSLTLATSVTKISCRKCPEYA